ncbi:hypothetical protein L227DRAFT_292194 [Lentinus tigrinus ALCF2SS1-6]|uniref:Uncharacterized protein n=1 Tax=Lentinus tigrinus ALCF2SS1-6 TaxID=1328759 RepID=A0A5C2RY93_9APHY|nr:hypothetical protein L227DRAFT_292194 [Lentinus tigrinus ALCF2SS1-6]
MPEDGNCRRKVRHRIDHHQVVQSCFCLLFILLSREVLVTCFQLECHYAKYLPIAQFRSDAAKATCDSYGGNSTLIPNPQSAETRTGSHSYLCR